VIVDLRRLVVHAQVVPGSRSTDAHALGLGIKARSDLNTQNARPPARLPLLEEGLDNLRVATAAPIATVAPDLTHETWGTILGRPQLIHEILNPDLSLLRALGMELPPTATQSSVRHLLVGVVARFASAVLTTDGTMTNPPVAGLGHLVLQTESGRPGMSNDAWLAIRWHASTLGAARHLMDLLELDAHGLRAERAPRALLLCAPRCGLDHATAVRAGLVMGYDLTVLEPSGYHNTARRQVTHPDTRPAIVIIADPEVGRTVPVVQAYLNAQPVGRIIDVDLAGPDALHQLLDTLAEGAGITPMLMLRTPADQMLFTRTTPIPVVQPGRVVTVGGQFIKLHEDCSNELWYTRDIAHHGGCYAKAYKLVGSKFEWQFDLDAEMRPMTKHKGQQWRTISLKLIVGL
jgi:hypothetical protein